MLPEPGAGRVEPRVPGFVESVVVDVPGSVNEVVVSAFVAVIPAFAVVVVGTASPGAAIAVEVPLAAPSCTTS